MNPNDIVGTPREYEVWLAPDWSDWDEKRSKGSGWARVSVRETLYADGRRIVQVLDENRQPITHQNLSEEIDKEQEKRYKDAQAKAEKEEDKSAPPGGIPTRTINGQVFQWNPQTRAYDIPTGQAPATTGSTTKDWRPEGRPDGQGGWDNSYPIMAAYVNGQRTGETREPNAKELQDWHEAQQRSRNPGGKSDQELETERRQQEADARAAAERNKPGAPTLKPDGKGGTIAVQTMPDGSIRTTPLPGVPSEASSKYSEVKQDPNTGQWHGLTREGRWEVISGGPTAAGSQTLPEGMPQFRPNFNDPDGAWGLVTYSNQLRELLTKRKPDGSPYLTQQQYEQLVRDAHAAATSAAGRLDTIVQQQRQAQANEISQRNVDAQVGVSRLNAANSATQTALQESRQLASAHTPESYRAGGGAILPAIMALQAQTAQAYGGMNMPARVQPDPNSAFGQMQTQSIPAVGELTRPAGPAGANSIGLGSVPGVVTPGPSGADVEAQRQQAMAANAAATRPILAPPPPVGPVPQATSMDASDPAQQGTPPPPPAPPVGTGAPGVTVQPVLSTPQNNLPPAMPIPPTGTLPSPGAMPAPGGAGGNVQMLPAINNLTAVTGIMSQRPGDPNWEWAVRTAAAEFGLL